MDFYLKPQFLLITILLFGGCCDVDGQDATTIYEQLNWLNALLSGGGCSVLASSQFADICRVADTTLANITFNGVMVSANLICESDCRCVMGARAGGTCSVSPNDGQMYCHCDYTSTATDPSYALTCPPVFAISTSQCGNNAIPILSGFLNDYLCNADCVCSHGYTNNTSLNYCTTSNGVSGNTQKYCVCGTATNAY